LALAAEISSALEEAHHAGVIHRDLKPSNVLVTPKGHAKVVDLGLAKVLHQTGDAAETLSETDSAAGTLPYMSPEQLRGEAVDARTDIFALGGLLYEMITGQRAFRGALASQRIDAILHQSPLPPRALNAHASAELERIILKCLEKDPANRYQSAKEFPWTFGGLPRQVPSRHSDHLQLKRRSGGDSHAQPATLPREFSR